MHRQVSNEPHREPISLTADELFDVLADSRRRYVIERLADPEQQPLTCTELALEIAADETHMPTAHVPRRRVEPVEDDLRSEHLPRLVEAGLVSWEGGAGAVLPGHSVEAVAALLREVDRRVNHEPLMVWSAEYADEGTDAQGPGSRSSPRS